MPPSYDSKADYVRVIAMANDMGPGENLRTSCPFCNNKERSFSLTMSEDGATLLYNCFRDKCGERGAVAYAPSKLTPVRLRAPKKKARLETDIVADIPLSARIELFERWGISGSFVERYAWGWCSSTQRVAIPFCGWYGETRGWVLRSLDPHVVPKALTAMAGENVGSYGWVWGNKDANTVLVVEDMISAYKTHWSLDGKISVFSLNGTGIPQSAEDWLVHACPPNLVFALDKDAVETMVKHVEHFRLLVPHVGYVLLDKDLKDKTSKEINECLASVL